MCLPICEILAVPARLHTGSPEMRTGVGFDLYTRVTNGKERAPGERSIKNHLVLFWSPYAYCDPRTRIVIDRTWSPYAYGDFTDPATHTGIFQSRTVCIMCSCAYGKLEIRSPYAKVCIRGSLPIPVRILGDPVRKRAGIAKISHMGRPRTQNESVPIRGPTDTHQILRKP